MFVTDVPHPTRPPQVAWSSFMAALAQNATSSVLAFLVWLFASAFVADSVLQHYMQARV